jgi:hypothetical protein
MRSPPGSAENASGVGPGQTGRLLLVTLHDRRGADMRKARIVARIVTRSPLAEQVPELVELDVEASRGVMVSKLHAPLPLIDQIVDALAKLLIGERVERRAPPFVGRQRRLPLGRFRCSVVALRHVGGVPAWEGTETSARLARHPQQRRPVMTGSDGKAPSNGRVDRLVHSHLAHDAGELEHSMHQPGRWHDEPEVDSMRREAL